MGIEVVVADVLTPETCDLYRRELPGCLIVHLTVSFSEALRRATSRKVWLSDDEFQMLHEADVASPPAADHRIQVDGLDLESQVQKVERLWARA